MASVWPAEAMRRGIGGAAKIECVVSAEGLLHDCDLLSESPAGIGFGGAALLLSRLFEMRPATRNGVAVAGASVVIPFKFYKPDEPISPEATANILNEPVWAQAPTAAQVAAVFPTGQLSKAGFGFSVTRCKFGAGGVLSNCATLSQRPEGAGFGDAAYRLMDHFKIDAAVYPAGTFANTYVDVPVLMRPPGSGPTEIPKPNWRRAFDHATVVSVFPAKALALHVTSGTAVLDCGVNQLGRLTGCAAVSESPPGLGFGDAAIKASHAMAMTAWTEKGEAVEGARVSVPITLDMSAPVAAAP
jgi:TonB family protein